MHSLLRLEAISLGVDVMVECRLSAEVINDSQQTATHIYTAITRLVCHRSRRIFI